MAYYNIRDLLGHWVKPKSAREKMCPHACCRGKRVHPANYPVILPDRLLRRATDHDLADGYDRGSQQRRAQILAEMERRDQLQIRRHERALEHKRRLYAKRLAHTEEVDRAWLEAEHATKGNMLNKAGKAAGVDERSLFTGPESVARRYASEELLNHWQTHHRPTARYMQGKDTRLGAQYTAPRRKRRGAVVTYRKITPRGGGAQVSVAVSKKAS
jgi:hypothetical protein